jgi:hypothetical protein
VTIFRKGRAPTYNDAEFDALFGRSWEKAIPYDRGRILCSVLFRSVGAGQFAWKRTERAAEFSCGPLA